MKVYMLKDVENVGMAGQLVTVSDGYAANFLFPRKMAVKVTDDTLAFYQAKQKKEQVAVAVLTTKVAMTAERIKNMVVTVKEKTHDNGKLYGAVGADEIVELLKDKEVLINKKQVEFEKAIKETGEHKVTIRLTSKLKPQLTVKVVSSGK